VGSQKVGVAPRSLGGSEAKGDSIAECVQGLEGLPQQVEWDLVAKLESVMKKTCRFHEPRLEPGAVFSNFHQCVVTLDKLTSTLDISDLQILFLELSQMIVDALSIAHRPARHFVHDVFGRGMLLPEGNHMQSSYD
jgi:hypothetical protein